jgi:hypothetical protein
MTAFWASENVDAVMLAAPSSRGIRQRKLSLKKCSSFMASDQRQHGWTAVDAVIGHFC